MSRKNLKDKNLIHYWLYQINDGKSVNEYASFFNALPENKKHDFINQVDGSGKSILQESFTLGKIDWIDFLIKNNVNLLNKDKAGWSFFNHLVYSSYLNNKNHENFNPCEVFTHTLDVLNDEHLDDVLDLLESFIIPFSARDLTNKEDFHFYDFLLKEENKEKHQKIKDKIGLLFIKSSFLNGNLLFAEHMYKKFGWDILDMVKKDCPNMPPLIFLLKMTSGKHFWSYSFSKPFFDDAKNITKDQLNNHHDECDFPLYICAHGMKHDSPSSFMFDFLLNIGADPFAYVPSRKNTLNEVIKNSLPMNFEVLKAFESAKSKKGLLDEFLKLNKQKVNLRNVSNHKKQKVI